MSTVPDIFNAVNNSVLSKYMNRMIKMENLLLEINGLFESVKLLDPIEDRVKEIEDQARSCKYMFESNITEIIDECNNDIIQMGRRVKEMEERVELHDQKIADLENHNITVGLIFGDYNEKTAAAEAKISKLGKRVEDEVIPSFNGAIKQLEDRIKKLEERPYVPPETMAKGLEDLVDKKIAANNEYLMDDYEPFHDFIERIVRSVVP
jgi:chromosome segregation ATPase